MWHLWRAFPESTAYILGFAARCRGPLDARRLARAFQQLVDRHASLRSRYRFDGSELIREAVALTKTEIDQVPKVQCVDHATWHAGRTPMSLDSGPVFQAQICAGDDGSTCVSMAAHHIAVDLWSLRILTSELGSLYRGEALPEAPDPGAFARWQSNWLQGRTASTAREWWRSTLAGLPPAERPTKPGPAGVNDMGLGADVSQGLQNLAVQHGFSPVAVLLGLWGLVLARRLGSDRSVIGVPSAGRQGTGLRRLVACTVNTLPFVVEIRGSFCDLIERVGQQLTNALRFQHLPLASMLDEIAVPFQNVLAYQGARRLQDWSVGSESAALQLDKDTTLAYLDWPPDDAPFETTLSIAHVANEFRARLVYDKWRLDAQESAALLRAFRVAASEALANPTLPLRGMRLNADDSPNWSVPAPHPAPMLPEAFRRAVERFPDSVAVAQGAQQFTYLGLEELANSVAQCLVEQGVRVEERVGVCLERRPGMVAVLLGILKTGAAYVPLDPGEPPARREALCKEAGVSRVIDQLPELATPRSIPTVNIYPDNLAYVLFTSGSTGPPKPVALTHRGAANLVAWSRVLVEPGMRVLAATPLTFDLSVFEIFSALAAGATVVLATDPLAMPADVDLINTVPSLLAERLRIAPLPPCVQRINLAGEPLPGELLKLIDGRVRTQNLYGPSETTTYSTVAFLEPNEELPAIGGPIDGTRLSILDDAGQPVPPGFPGELHIGGAGVARGYLDRAGETASRFLPDPADEEGRRAYRTGDRVRRRADGQLIYLGRIDRQVKLHGVRIEPAGIERVLNQAAGVSRVAVQVRDDQLLAWFTGTADARDLRLWSLERLPSHHIPASFQYLDSFPVGPHGKVDYKALPAHQQPKQSPSHSAATETEHRLATIFAEVLDRDRIDVSDDFFASGGNSLRAARLLARINRELSLDAELAALYRAPTVRSLAKELQGAPAVTEVPPPRMLPQDARPTFGAATFGQMPIWTATEMSPQSPVYDMQLEIDLEGDLDRQAISKALDSVCSVHESLRTAFLLDGGKLVQRVTQSCPAPLLMDAASGPRHSVALPLDPTRGRVFRAALLSHRPGRHKLLLNIHHLVADARSIEVIVRDLGEAYSAASVGAKPALEPAPVGMIDYAIWERQYRNDASWWRHYLVGSLASTRGALPYKRHPRSMGSGNRFDGARVSVNAPDGGFEALAESWSLPPVAVAGALLASVLSQSGSIAIATPVSLRDIPELDQVVGYLTRVVVVTVDVPNADLRVTAERFAAALLEARQHSREPIEVALDSAPPLMISEAYAGMPAINFNGLGVMVEPRWTQTAKVDLALYYGGRGGGYLEYNSGRFLPETIQGLAASVRNLIARPTAPVAPPIASARENSLSTETSLTYRSETERALAALFAAALGIERIGREDDFFTFGGQSLKAVVVVSAIAEQLQVSIPLRTVFEHPTVAELAPRIDAEIAKLEQLLEELEGLDDDAVAARLLDP